MLTVFKQRSVKPSNVAHKPIRDVAMNKKQAAPLTANSDEHPMSSRVDKQLTGRRLIRTAAESVQQHISRQAPVQQHFSFMPTLLTRVSPFHFPVRGKTADWPLVRLDSGESNSWGRMRVVGELLVIFDETILFCLLALMARKNSESFETHLDDICRLAVIQADSRQRNNVRSSIQRLAGTRIDLELASGKGNKRKCISQMTGSILSFADMHHETGRVRVIINPYFIELYAESFVTNIDLHFRSTLQYDLSKALYRFFQGQYERQISADLLRLARAVNLDTQQPEAQLRKKIRGSLNELQSKGYVAAYDIDKRKRVSIVKARHTAIDLENQILGSNRIPFL
jgi:hypothetical protein